MKNIYYDVCFHSTLTTTLEHDDFKYLVSCGEVIIPWIMEELCNSFDPTITTIKSLVSNEEYDVGWTQILLLTHLVKDDYIKENLNLGGRFDKQVDLYIEWWKRKQREKKLKRIL